MPTEVRIAALVMSESTRAYIREIKAEAIRLAAFAEHISQLTRQGELPRKALARTTLELSRLPEAGNVVEEFVFRTLMDSVTHLATRQ